MPSLPWMKLWQRRKAVRSISGSARRSLACDATSRVPMDSSDSGQSPIGLNLTSNRCAHAEEEELESVGPQAVLAVLAGGHRPFE
jgi:hypothetical protein